MDKNKISFLLLLFILPSFILLGQEEEEDVYTDEDNYEHVTYSRKKGFMFGVNIGMLLANNTPAEFYSGYAPNSIFPFIENTNSNSYQVLVDYFGTTDFFLFELPVKPTEMDYQMGVNFGFNGRYQMDWGNAFVGDFNFSNLQATGAAVFSVRNTDPTLPGGYSSENIALIGKESRFMASIGYQANLTEPSAMGLFFELGPSFTSVKVNKNVFVVGTREFNILRSQLVAGNQYINNRQPTVNDFGGYSALGFNMEFDKFTVDAIFRAQYERVKFDPNIEAKYKFNFLPHLRFVYRIIK